MKENFQIRKNEGFRNTGFPYSKDRSLSIEYISYSLKSNSGLRMVSASR